MSTRSIRSAKVFDAVILHGGGSRVRTDLDIPVWKLLAETDVQNQAANRQPDTNRFRTWEVAGDSHVDIKFTSYSRQLAARDGSPSAPAAAPAGGRGGRGGGGSCAGTGAPAGREAPARSDGRQGLGSTSGNAGGMRSAAVQPHPVLPRVQRRASIISSAG